MEKLDHPEINTSELTAEVRKAIARQVLKSHAGSTDASDPTSQAMTPGPGDDHSTLATPLSTDVNFASLNPQLSSLSKSPKLERPQVFKPNPDDQYRLNDLLKFHDADFLNAAYRAILKREPDTFGYNYYLEQLRDGHIDQVDVLAILRFSSEGKLRNVQIKGLALPTFMRRLGHLPVIGYPIRLGIDLLRLPVLSHRTRQHEARLLAQNQTVSEHANELARHIDTVIDTVNEVFAGYLSNVNAALTDLSKKTELQANEQEHLKQQLEALANHQQKSVDDLRRELREQIDQERNSAQKQMLGLIRQQQSLFDSSIDETRARIVSLESSARAWIADLESSLDARFGRIEASAEDLSSKITHAESTASDLQDRLGSVESATDKFESATRTTQTEIGKVYQQLHQARTELALQGRRMALIFEEARKRLPAAFDQQQLEIIAAEEQHKLDALYAELEDNFRGTPDEIKERFRTYLPYVKSLGGEMPIVDLGCGRGEWLELLKEDGYKALGVDTNQVLLDRCRARGLDVIEIDALKYLRGLPDNSLGAVTGFHIIEHLQIEVLVSLLDEIVRVLQPGGLVIFETPNPENVLVGSNFFYFDPTHRNPVPSLLVKFLLESRGLDRIEVMNLHAWDQARIGGENELTARFNELFYGPMDYAIAGWKVSE
jgi:O-antigen chain-terminating methyltransferase